MNIEPFDIENEAQDKDFRSGLELLHFKQHVYWMVCNELNCSLESAAEFLRNISDDVLDS